ncbi:beta-ketoacyl-[acyl-carrier-protein] synthase family protein, partial [candidate division FCPU426 bacterium]|nr:beta-ketoacyl-[acyl-carrier-protein] synthase family protein [candidate division FCPU426 bacterium]
EKCMPFDAQRQGLVFGEGAGLLVLEAEESLRRRGHTPLARLEGYGWSNDAHHLSAPHPEGWGTRQAIVQALQDAGMDPTDIDMIVAHGTGTPWNDQVEAQVFAGIFGAEGCPVTAPKSAVGHCMGAASAVEAVIGLWALQQQKIPPTPNHIQKDPACPIDVVVSGPRSKTMRACLTNSSGFGGNNISMIFTLTEKGRQRRA